MHPARAFFTSLSISLCVLTLSYQAAALPGMLAPPPPPPPKTDAWIDHAEAVKSKVRTQDDMSELAPLVSEQHGVFFFKDTNNGEPMLKLLASYGYQTRKHLSNRFLPGEGLVGQCVLEKQRILLTEVPDGYIKVSSGLFLRSSGSISRAASRSVTSAGVTFTVINRPFVSTIR